MPVKIQFRQNSHRCGAHIYNLLPIAKCNIANTGKQKKAIICLSALIFFFSVKPVNTAIGFSTKSVKIGGSVTIMCSSDGFPEPRFTIFHNDTKAVSTEKTYTICNVKWSDAGMYKCFARNELGNDAAFAIFTVEGKADIRFLYFKSTRLFFPLSFRISGIIKLKNVVNI